MKISDYLQKNSSALEQIISAILQKNSAFLLANSQKKLTKKQVNTIEFLYQKYQNNWPLPYLLNYQYFYKLKLEVNPKVLIPRPETEVMIDLIIQESQKFKNQKLNFLDIGTGSGAIILNLAHVLKKNNNFSFFASDVDINCLNLAKKNAKNHNLVDKIKFIHSNLLNNINLNSHPLIIAANLPYLNEKQIENTQLEKEPKLALYGGKHGIEIYNQLFNELKKLKKIKLIKVFIEIDPKQKKMISEKVKKQYNTKVLSHKDLRGKIRFLEIEIIN